MLLSIRVTFFNYVFHTCEYWHTPQFFKKRMKTELNSKPIIEIHMYKDVL